MNRISLRDVDGKQVFNVAIRSLKKDRTYILGLFVAKPTATHLVYRERVYNASDLYGRF